VPAPEGTIRNVPKTVLVAPTSFKGSLSAAAAARAIGKGWLSERPNDIIQAMPQADGGEGTLDAIEASITGATRHTVAVTGPEGKPVEADWLLLPNRVAVVELAESSGLPLMPSLDALGATTRGLGEVLLAALETEPQSILIALGGSASTDGGAGALSALGVRLHDKRGKSITDGGGGLMRLTAIDASRLTPPPPGGVTLLCDVTTPLLGPSGAAAVFGPQKGADADDILLLEHGLKRYSQLLGGDPTAVGSGAAGGTAFGFMSVWGAQTVSGADYLAELTGFDKAIKSADLLITGEGKFDSQSLVGKVTGQLLERAANHSVPTALIAGQKGDVAAPGWSVTLDSIAGSVAAAITNPTEWLFAAGARAAREID
jgi:glycerate 2-kinase